jgi:hypothetical protein
MMVIKNLNQLLCVTLVLSGVQAYRSYIKAETKNNHQLTFINGTNWNVVVGYKTPAGVSTNDTVASNTSKTIDVSAKDPVSYSLSKEKAQTETRILPPSTVQQGTFQISTDMIKDLIAPFVTVAQPVQTPQPIQTITAPTRQGTAIPNQPLAAQPTK